MLISEDDLRKINDERKAYLILITDLINRLMETDKNFKGSQLFKESEKTLGLKPTQEVS